MTEGTKVCKMCGKDKPLSELSSVTRQMKSGPRTYYNSWCKPCANDYSKEHYAANRPTRQAQNKIWRTANPKKLRGYWLKKTYGITLEEYDAILAGQQGVCAICYGTYDVLFVDHDHDTGRIRGLLCNGCNTELGMFKDSPEFLVRASLYVVKE